MTISVRIMNEDPRETAVIVVSQETLDGKSLDGMIDRELVSGASVTMYVHSGNSLRVREVSQ